METNQSVYILSVYHIQARRQKSVDMNGTRIVYVDGNLADEGPVLLLSAELSFSSTLPGKVLV